MTTAQIKQAIIALLQENDSLLVSEITTKLNDRYHGGYAHHTNEEVLDLLKEIQSETGVCNGSLELTAPTKEVAKQSDVVFVPYSIYNTMNPLRKYKPKAMKRRAIRKLFY
ncbi:hypothetical protein [Bacillus mycoides]|uniref:Uncharacterized protein n=1 Tax=Bacillus mycoides (strain KBAB4) TaxID=315730 RepID=A9VVG3_BACMK|nr:hypothetical protein [Bacillus mycoides]ABY46778.1 hypothetical protein BcerKBAB4_5283 [Bacillus mycoides KBAB4]